MLFISKARASGVENAAVQDGDIDTDGLLRCIFRYAVEDGMEGTSVRDTLPEIVPSRCWLLESEGEELDDGVLGRKATAAWATGGV